MNDVLLYRCSSSIEAVNMTNVLEVNGIAYRQHDETMDQRVGAYGPNPGIAIYVAEEDYCKAKELIDFVLPRPTESTSPFCPRCGSEETVSQPRSKYATPLIILSILLFLAPCLYIFHTPGWGTTHYIATAIFLLNIILMFIINRLTKNYRCSKCGKRFGSR